MKLSVVAIVSVFCIMLSCKKSNVTSALHVDADLLSRFSFKPGSYWIYKNSINGEIDSFAVWENEYAPSAGSGGYDINGIEIKGYGPPDTPAMQFQLYGDAIGMLFLDEYSPLVEYPFQLGSLYRSIPDGASPFEIWPDDSSGIINIFSSLTINGQTFDSVAEVFHIGASANAYGILFPYNDTFFIASGVGIIEMNLHHPQDTGFYMNIEWTIIKSQIIL